MLPLVPMLLHEDEPIPVFALKMIGDCLEAVQDIALPSVRAWGSPCSFSIQLGPCTLQLITCSHGPQGMLWCQLRQLQCPCLNFSEDLLLAVRRQGLLPQFFGFLSLDSPHNNVHNLRVCQLLLESRALEPADLQQHGIVQKVCNSAVHVSVFGLQTSITQHQRMGEMKHMAHRCKQWWSTQWIMAWKPFCQPYCSCWRLSSS